MFLEWLQSKYPYTDFHELNLDFMIAHFKQIMDSLVKIDGWIENHEEEYEELKKLYDDLVAGRFTPEFLNSLHDWLDHNAFDIIGEMVKMVFFGITDDGYFVAYIPDSWDDIRFGTTGLDDFPAGVDYGHLTLTY